MQIMLTSLFKSYANFRDAMTILNGTCVRTKVWADGLLNDESASHTMLNGRVDDAVVGVG